MHLSDKNLLRGFEYRNIYDLGTPTSECDMPPTIPAGPGVGTWHTCIHCGVLFILIVLSRDDPTQNLWVNNFDFTRMLDAQEGKR